MFSEIQIELKNILQLDQVSIVPLKEPITIGFYEKWLSQNYYGTMNYLKDHFELKKQAKKINPRFESVITVTQSYFPVLKPTAQKLSARIATYAQNEDYHYWLKDKLNVAIEILKQKFPDDIFAAYVDSGPVLEKDIAFQAGHGWFGKNSCLIHPKKGSLFFVAEILSSINTDQLKLNPIITKPDMCGTCNRCMVACPTQAIIAPQIIKADQCISYLTIESKIAPPMELRTKISDWFFGCDICQTVCPWNEKVFRTDNVPDSHATSTDSFLNLNQTEKNDQIIFFKMILTSSNKQLQKYFFGTALHRAAGFGLKRNALVVIANRKIIELKSDVTELTSDPKLGELAQWTLNNLTDY